MIVLKSKGSKKIEHEDPVRVLVKRLMARKKKARRSRKGRPSPSPTSPLIGLGTDACAAARQLIAVPSVQFIILAAAFFVLLALLRSWTSSWTNYQSAEAWPDPVDRVRAAAHLGAAVPDPLKGWRKVIKQKPDGAYEDYFFNRITGEKSVTVPMEMVDGEIRGVWQRFMDSDSQRFFYRNTDTGEVTWLPPTLFKDDPNLFSVHKKPSHLRGGLPGSSGGEEGEGGDGEPGTLTSAIAHRDRHIDNNNTQDAQPVIGSATGQSQSEKVAASVNAELAELSLNGWKRIPTTEAYRKQHPAAALFYFFNEHSNNVTWTALPFWQEKLKEVAKRISIAEAEDGPFTVSGKATLKGWQRHWDKSRKEYFYSDVLTGESTWKAPNDAWRRRNRREQYCDPVPLLEPQTKADGPSFEKHDKFLLFDALKFDISHEADLTSGTSETPEECCRFCELEKLCLGFVHSGSICYLKKEGAEVETRATFDQGEDLKTVGIRIKAGSMAEDLDSRSELVAKMQTGTFVLY